jgi:hypothetical protein
MLLLYRYRYKNSNLLCEFVIRCEGSIPKSPLAANRRFEGSLGAEPRVWILSQIPYENNHTPPDRRSELTSPAQAGSWVG